MIITYSYTFDVLEFSKLQKKVPNELQKNTQSRAKKKNNSIKIWEQKKYYKTKTSIEKGNLPCYTFINYEGIY